MGICNFGPSSFILEGIEKHRKSIEERVQYVLNSEEVSAYSKRCIKKISLNAIESISYAGDDKRYGYDGELTYLRKGAIQYKYKMEYFCFDTGNEMILLFN